MKRIATVQRRVLVLLASIALVMLSAAGAAASQAGFVYALRAQQQADSQIFGYSLDPLTGRLVLLPGFPMGTGGEGFESSAPEMMAYASGRLFVLNTSSNTLSVFAVNPSTGALTHLPFSPFALEFGPPMGSTAFCVAVHPSGSPVVVGGATSDSTVSWSRRRPSPRRRAARSRRAAWVRSPAPSAAMGTFSTRADSIPLPLTRSRSSASA